MSEFEELLSRLEGLRAQTAIFRKVVLHAHSPASFDWTGTKGDQVRVKDEFTAGLRQSGLDLMALTDHFKCRLACDLSRPLRRPRVLPGLEVALRPPAPLEEYRVHLLAIFPEGHETEQVWRIMPPRFVSEDRATGKEEIGDVDIREFIAGVHKCGGICIAAHVDSRQGVRFVFRQTARTAIALYEPGAEAETDAERGISERFKEWLLTAGLDGIEVAKCEDKHHYRLATAAEGKKVSMAVLLTNDAHCLDDLCRPERWTTMKMTSVGFEGLRQALRFPDTRIRFPEEVPESPSPRILGLHVQGPSGSCFFTDLALAFSDNLTCIIGPRGSGKSAALEALRYVFGYNRTLAEIGPDLAKKVKELQAATLKDSLIRVAYDRKDGERHILEAAFDAKQDYMTRVFVADGEDQKVPDVESSGLYPLRFFGWSEIETLGREPQRQRELLDRLVPGVGEELALRESARRELRSKRRALETCLEALDGLREENRGEISRYQEYRSEFETLNTPEAKVLFSELDAANTRVRVLGLVRDNARRWIESLRASSSINVLEGLEELLPELPEPVRDWWRGEKERLRLADRLPDIRSQIEKARNVLVELVRDIESGIEAARLEAEQKERAIRGRIGGETARVALAERRTGAQKQLTRVEDIRRRYRAEWKKLENLLGEWRALCDVLRKTQDVVTGVRTREREEIERQLNALRADDIKISLDFVPGGDRGGFAQHLSTSGFLKRDLHGNYRATRLPERLSAVCIPVELALAILDRAPTALARAAKLGGAESVVEEPEAQKLVHGADPFSRDEGGNVEIADRKKLSMVMSLAEVPWDDFLSVLLNDRPVGNLSPGQRSSAMLPLIALAEDTPLVIDQPEDNLDNRMIGRTLVDILARLKEKRQIIVATHNPNIVVSGDAEQVIVLEALSDSEGGCVQHGSIDNPEIVTSVIDIMEGGREAFLARKRRYELA